MRSLRSLLVAGMVGATFFSTAPAMAQACLGLPLGTGQSAASLAIGFPNNATSFGFSGTTRLSDPVTVGGGYTLTSYDVDGVDAAHGLQVGGAYEFSLQEPGAQLALNLCPNLSLGYTTWSETDVISVPLGLGLGLAIPVADASAVVAPFINPALTWNRVSAGDFSDSDTDFGFNAGANVLVSNLFFGADYGKVGEGDGVFRIRGGMIF